MRRMLLACLALPLLAHAADGPRIKPWGFDLAGEDASVAPGQDFFERTDGRAVAAMVIPPDRSSYGSFIALAELSEQRTHDILEAEAAKAVDAPNTSAEKAGAMYRAFMDEDRVETLGAKPLAADLAAIRAVTDASAFAALIGTAPRSFQGSVFGLSIGPDQRDPTMYTITLTQAGLGLPDRDYYTEPAFAPKLAEYKPFVARMLGLIGWDDPDGSAAAVVAFEDRIARASWTRTERRDVDKTYNPTDFDDLVKSAPGFDWAAFLGAADLGKPARVVVSEPTAVAAIAALVGETPVATLRAWAAFHLASNAASVLPTPFVEASFAFHQRSLQGQPEQRARWKRAVSATEGALGEAVGELYVARYFTAEAKARMDAICADLRAAFRARLERNAWMAPQTRELALGKLAGFDFQIGYPRKWRDYSGLTIRSDDLYGDAERATAFEWAFWVDHLPRKVDRDLWEMLPETVNAYNDPQFNQVVFPAAILQPPFFDPDADPAVNYGGIGAVIGHEMTHSFDDQGRKYDVEGRLRGWWTDEDVTRFKALSAKLGAQFSAMSTLPGTHINGDLTMGENIADLGGLTLALDAYHASLHGKDAPVIDGVTGDQRVFLGWAQVWRGKVRDERARQLLTIDPHSPPRARVNGPVRNIPGWYEAFGIKEGDAMYLPPDGRVLIW